jgi:hypothetical protein
MPRKEDSSDFSGTSSNNMVLMTENSNINIDDSASSSFALPETMTLLSNFNDDERTLAAKSYSSGGGNRNNENNDDLYSEFCSKPDSTVRLITTTLVLP